MKLTMPELALVVLVGASGSGKSSFARAHFRPTEVLSSDFCRGLVSDDENDQAATTDAFDVLHFIAAKRLKAGRLTVVDATNVQPEARKPLLALARDHDVLPVAIVLNLPEKLCQERNRDRPDRDFGPHVIRRQSEQLRRSLRNLQREGFRYVHVLSTPEQVAAATIERQPLWNNRKELHGPFDIIGDVHGCYAELRALLHELGYEWENLEPRTQNLAAENKEANTAPAQPAAAGLAADSPRLQPRASVPRSDHESPSGPVSNRPVPDAALTPDATGEAADSQQNEPQTAEGRDEVNQPPSQPAAAGLASDSPWLQPWEPIFRHPEGRVAVFVGDLVDRGPQIPAVLRLVMNMVAAGTALCVPGNHDLKLARRLKGRDVQITHGLADSLAQLEGESPEFRKRVLDFLDGLISHYVLDDGKLVVAHAGLKEAYQGRGSQRVREFALYGETTGETDEFGLPIRYNWAAEYRGPATVVYGHTPVPEPEWLNRTINIDTGCVFGGRLTALRYPENALVSVPAAHTYAEPARPFLAPEDAAPALTAQQQQDDVLDVADVLGKRMIGTRLHRQVTIREENAITALEVMSRFAADPKWLIYLPPTMSPSETSSLPDLLEHPAEAFGYYRQQGVPQVVVEAKHMGSRAVVVVCRDADAARRHFGVRDGAIGVCYTRTGRRFFDDAALESALLERIRAALTAADFWARFDTTWACLDCELLPWSAKAQALLQHQYAAVGAAARSALEQAVPALAAARATVPGVAELYGRYAERGALVEAYVASYRRYCWPVRTLTDLKLAPFHLLASEGAVHVDKTHVWHMQTLAELCAADPELLLATPFKLIDVTDPGSEADGVSWWEELTAQGGEGMVVKPLDFVARGQRGLLQPAVKCRGREYLRIIYGPEYTLPEHLERLRARGLSAKRSLALREFALGVEALERFVRHEPLRRVHECVFGVLALESEPVDPRL